MRRLWLGVAAALLAAPLPAAARSGAKPIVGVLHTGATGRIAGSVQYFSYGVVLRNRSTTKDAFSVKARVFVLGDAGLVGVYVTTIPFIPARTTYFLGNEPAALSTVQHATGVRAVISVGGTKEASGSLPSATAKPSSSGRIHGSINNHYKRSISTYGTKVFAVYYDSGGKVIGGDRLKGLTYSVSTIDPKRAASFSARIGPAVSPTRIARVAVSVSPVLAKP